MRESNPIWGGKGIAEQSLCPLGGIALTFAVEDHVPVLRLKALIDLDADGDSDLIRHTISILQAAFRTLELGME